MTGKSCLNCRFGPRGIDDDNPFTYQPCIDCNMDYSEWESSDVTT